MLLWNSNIHPHQSVINDSHQLSTVLTLGLQVSHIVSQDSWRFLLGFNHLMVQFPAHKWYVISGTKPTSLPNSLCHLKGGGKKKKNDHHNWIAATSNISLCFVASLLQNIFPFLIRNLFYPHHLPLSTLPPNISIYSKFSIPPQKQNRMCPGPHLTSGLLMGPNHGTGRVNSSRTSGCSGSQSGTSGCGPSGCGASGLCWHSPHSPPCCQQPCPTGVWDPSATGPHPLLTMPPNSLTCQEPHGLDGTAPQAGSHWRAICLTPLG